MKKTWSVYDANTRKFTGRRFTVRDRDVEANLADGERAKEGVFDHLSQCVDESGEVIDFQPESPGPEYEWDEQGSRWVIRVDVQQRREHEARALAEMESLERLQVRSMSELFDNPDDLEAREHFDRRKARIDELRRTITESRQEA